DVKRVPVPCGAAPAEGEKSEYRPRDPAFGAVANGCEIGNEPNVPKQNREQEVAQDRPKIPYQRTAPLRPQRHRVGIRNKPIEIEWPAEMQDWKQHSKSRRAQDNR